MAPTGHAFYEEWHCWRKHNWLNCALNAPTLTWPWWKKITSTFPFFVTDSCSSNPRISQSREGHCCVGLFWNHEKHHWGAEASLWVAHLLLSRSSEDMWPDKSVTPCSWSSFCIAAAQCSKRAKPREHWKHRWKIKQALNNAIFLEIRQSQVAVSSFSSHPMCVLRSVGFLLLLKSFADRALFPFVADKGTRCIENWPRFHRIWWSSSPLDALWLQIPYTFC